MAGLMTGLNFGMPANCDYLFAGESPPTPDNQVLIEFCCAAQGDIGATLRIPLAFVVAWLSQITQSTPEGGS
jgi:hypothetical protein